MVQFWMKDVAKTQRVKFMLQNEKKYMLSPSMLISFGLKNVYLVMSAYPYFNQRKHPSIIKSNNNINKKEKENKNKYLDTEPDQPQQKDSNVPNNQYHYFNPGIENFEKYLTQYQKESKNPNYLQTKINNYKNFNDDEDGHKNPYLKLLGIGGKVKGKEILLDQGTYTFGNNAGNTYKIEDTSISKEQFGITYSNDYGWVIYQQNNTLGTFLHLVSQQDLELNLPSKQHLIEDDMTFKLGDYIIKSNIIYNE